MLASLPFIILIQCNQIYFLNFFCIETRAPTGLEPSEPGTSLFDIPVYSIQDFDVTAAVMCTIRVNTICSKSE